MPSVPGSQISPEKLYIRFGFTHNGQKKHRFVTVRFPPPPVGGGGRIHPSRPCKWQDSDITVRITGGRWPIGQMEHVFYYRGLCGRCQAVGGRFEFSGLSFELGKGKADA